MLDSVSPDLNVSSSLSVGKFECSYGVSCLFPKSLQFAIFFGRQLQNPEQLDRRLGEQSFSVCNQHLAKV